MEKNSRKSLVALLLLLLVGVVGGTIAYFTSTADFSNVFKTATYSTVTEERFVSPDKWTPGTTTDKEVKLKNNGNIDVAVRVSYKEAWDRNLALKLGDQTVAIVNFANTGDWTLAADGYYYYNKAVKPGEPTSTFIDSVTFNPAIEFNNSMSCVKSDVIAEGNKTGEKVECTTDNASYAGATYTLDVKVESVQFDKVQEAWGTAIPATPAA